MKMARAPRLGLGDVYNPSMLPTLRPGDRLLLWYGARVRPGDVIVLRHPLQHDLLVVKRAVERRDGGWWVQGDNPSVTNDSREFGVVPDELVRARAVLRLRSRPRGGPGGRHRLVLLARWAWSSVRPLGSRSWRSRRLRAR